MPARSGPGCASEVWSKSGASYLFSWPLSPFSRLSRAVAGVSGVFSKVQPSSCSRRRAHRWLLSTHARSVSSDVGRTSSVRVLPPRLCLPRTATPARAGRIEKQAGACVPSFAVKIAHSAATGERICDRVGKERYRLTSRPALSTKLALQASQTHSAVNVFSGRRVLILGD